MAFKFNLQITLWLWFTVLFANFAEAWRKAAARRRRIRCAKRGQKPWPTGCSADGQHRDSAEFANCARRYGAGLGRRVHSRRDGEIIEGVASVDESAITGESAPVIREAAATVRP